MSWARLSRTLRDLGGFCDCEIAMNDGARRSRENVAEEPEDDEED